MGMFKRIGGPTPNLERVWENIDRHERILKKILDILEKMNEEIEKK